MSKFSAPSPLQKLRRRISPGTFTALTSPAHLHYFFQLPFMPESGDALALIGSRSYLFLSPLFTFKPSGNSAFLLKQLSDISATLKSLRTSKPIWIESRATYRFVQLLARCGHNVEADSLDPILSDLRQLKTAPELTAIRRAATHLSDIVSQALDRLEPGITEKSLALWIKQALLGQNASFTHPPIVAFGSNSAVPHHTPTSKPWHPNLVALVDVVATIDNYHADMTRTLVPETAPRAAHRIKQIVDRAYLKALELLQPGVVYGDVDSAARDVIDQAGYGANFIHSTGHGLGLDIHETPGIFPDSTDVVRAGQIITIEPGIYLPGKFGYRYENTLAIQVNSVANLTS